MYHKDYISLLIFCIDHLSTHFLYFYVTVNSTRHPLLPPPQPFLFLFLVYVCFMYWGTLLCDIYIFTIIMPFLGWSLDHIISCNTFILKYILSDLRLGNLDFFWFLFAWNRILLFLLTAGLYLSVGLKWVSSKQNVYVSY